VTDQVWFWLQEKPREKGKWFWFEAGFDVIYLSCETDFADWTWEEFKRHRLGAAQNCSATLKGNHKLTDAVLPPAVLFSKFYLIVLFHTTQIKQHVSCSLSIPFYHSTQMIDNGTYGS